MGVVRTLRDPRSAGAQAIPADADLVRAARDGHKWAQEALFRRHGRMAAGLAHRVLASGQADVDDLVQDAFVAAFTRLDSLQSPEAFSTWLGSIVIRLASKRLRRRSLMTRLGLYRTEEFDFDPVSGYEPPTDIAVELREMYALLDRLKPEERIALVLRRVDGLGVAEIAEQMDMSMSTVKRRLRVAEERLDRALSASRRSRPGDLSTVPGPTPSEDSVDGPTRPSNEDPTTPESNHG